MFGFLSKFGNLKLDPIGVYGGRFVGRSVSETNYKPKDNVTVSLELVLEPGSTKTITFEGEIVSLRGLQSGGQVLSITPTKLSGNGVIQLGDAIEKHRSNVPTSSLDRRSERIPWVVKVIGELLPGYRGVTVNISAHGLLVECDGPLVPGTYMNLVLQLEHFEIPEVEIQTVVVWTQPLPKKKRQLLGLQFTQQHPQVEGIWASYYQTVLQGQFNRITGARRRS